MIEIEQEAILMLLAGVLAIVCSFGVLILEYKGLDTGINYFGAIGLLSMLICFVLVLKQG